MIPKITQKWRKHQIRKNKEFIEQKKDGFSHPFIVNL